jgi:TatD DNase family protein
MLDNAEAKHLLPRNTMLIDTHCQLNLMVKKDFNRALTDTEIAAAKIIIDEAKSAGISPIVTIGSSPSESENCVRLADTYATVFATIGLHPGDCTSEWRTDLAEIKKLFNVPGADKIVGVGEIGLDYYWPGFDKQQQKECLNAQIELALEKDLPFVLHARDAHEDLLIELLRYKKDFEKLSRPTGVMHCFSYTQEIAKEFIDLGFMLGLGGIITYPKNNALRETIKTLDLKNLVLETDAPFLPPQSMRGKPNHPAQIATIGHFLADLRGISFEEVAAQTTANARKLFRLP